MNLAELNSALNFREYNEGKVLLESYPQYLIVELTRSCNLKCPMCRDSKAPYAGQSMSMEVFERVQHELFDKARMIDLRGWGESLVLENAIDLIERAGKSGKQLRFVTNLSFKRNEILEILAKYNCKVDISIDSPDEDILVILRGGANLRLMKENLAILSSFYKKYHGNTRNLSFLTTVQYPALKTLHELIPLAAEFSIREVRMFPVDISSESELSLEDRETEVEDMLSKVKNLSKKYEVNAIVGAKMGCMSFNSPSLPACIHPWAYCYISYNGKVGFCDHLIGPSFDDILMGDITTTPFVQIWNSENWQSLRYNHLIQRDNSIKNFKHCSWCYKNKYIDFEDLFDPGLAVQKVVL